jgi:DNA-binding MarR family transcriptional regulator
VNKGLEYSTPKYLLLNDNIVVDYVLRYDLYRHRDVSERLSSVLKVGEDPDAFNRSTWDILFYIIQCYLEDMHPSVSDIYLSVSISKGTAISGLAELERRGGIEKASDHGDKRRRLITISPVIETVILEFIEECREKLAPAGSTQSHTPIDQNTAEPVSGEPLINLLHELSHDVRTPLTAIIGFSDMIADKALGPVQPVGYAEYARDIGKAAADLLNSLNERVDTALAEHGVAISLGPIVSGNIEEIVDQACRGANATASRRGVHLRRKWGTKNGLVMTDKERLTQAIRKLIEGITLKTPRGQTVDIETSILMKDGKTVVSVRILSSLDVSPLDPTMQQLSFRDDEMLERSIGLISAIAASHGGYIVSETDSDNCKIHSLCLPLTAT